MLNIITSFNQLPFNRKFTYSVFFTLLFFHFASALVGSIFTEAKRSQSYSVNGTKHKTNENHRRKSKWAKSFIISIILIETNSEKQKKETTNWHWNHIHSQTAVGIYSISLNCWFNSSSFWVCIMKIYHQRMKNENSATNEKFNSEFRI